jgi:hypothetical protein
MTPEQVDHINLVNWFHHTYPELADDFHHFANERKCSIQQGRILKRMGVKKGVYDFFLALPQNGNAGFWLELKVGSGKLSLEQEQFGLRKTMRGYVAVHAWGFEAAKELILSYLRNYEPISSYTLPKTLFNGKPIC